MNTSLFTESPFHRIHPDISLLQLEIYSPLKAEFEHLEQFSRCHLGDPFLLFVDDSGMLEDSNRIIFFNNLKLKDCVEKEPFAIFDDFCWGMPYHYSSIFLRLREIPSDIVRIIVYLNAYQDKEMPAVDFGMSEFIRVRLENCDVWRNLPENLSERDREVTSTIVQWEVTKPTDKSTVIHLAEFSKVNSCWELQFDGTPLPANVKIKNVLRNHGAKF